MAGMAAHFMSERLSAVWAAVPSVLKASGTKPVTRPSQADFNAAMSKRMGNIHRAFDDFTAGKITDTELFDRMDSELFAGHAEAWALGRRRATGKGPKGVTVADRLMAVAAKDEEQEWLQAFQDDVKSGRYQREDGTWMDGAMKTRAGLYVGKMRGTSNVSLVEHSPDDVEWAWVLLPENNCQDCPRIAARSPYTKATLFTHPGNGDTECLGNCKCFLKRTDGVEGFRRMDVTDEGQADPVTAIDPDTGDEVTIDVLDLNPDGLKPLADMTAKDYEDYGRTVWARIAADNPEVERFEEEARKAADKLIPHEQELARLKDEERRAWQGFLNREHERDVHQAAQANLKNAEAAFRVRAKEAERAQSMADTLSSAAARGYLDKFTAAENDTQDPFDFILLAGQASGLDAAKPAIRQGYRYLPARYRNIVKDGIQVKVQGGRAYYQPGTKVIHTHGDPITFFHELAHRIEHADPNELRISIDYLFERIDPKQINRLNKLYPGGGYGKSELAEPDGFTTAYFGKVYHRGLWADAKLSEARKLTRDTPGWDASEILSMSVEWIMGRHRNLYTKDRRTMFMILGRLADRR